MNIKDLLEILNGLDESELNACHIAALLGNTFSLDHVLEFSNIKPSKLLSLLDKLAHQNVIKEKSGSSKGRYFFTRKYFSTIILKKMDEGKLKLCLSDIISHFERDLPDDGNKPLILADLYLKFKDNNKNSFQYMKKAADLLISAHKTGEARKLYEKIIDKLFVKKRDSLESLLLVDSVISYAPIAVTHKPPEKISPVIKKAINLADDLRNNVARAMLELCLGHLYQRQGNSIKASDHYNKGWRLAQGTGDIDLLRTTSKLSALSLFWQGKMKEAIQMYEHTLGNVEEISPDLRDLWAYLMLAYCYGITGRVARGIGLAEAIKQRAISIGQLKTQAFADAVIALILLEVRQIQTASPHINKALEIGGKVGGDLVFWMAQPCKAYEVYSGGDLKGAKEILESAISHAENLGQIHHPSPWVIEILWSLHKAKWNPIKGYSFASEIARLTSWPDIYMKGAALRYHALDQKISGADFKDIKQLLEESQKLLTEAGARIELGRTQVELARLFIATKDEKRAKELANAAHRTLYEIDRSLFPSELLFLIQKKSKESRMLNGISALGGAIGSMPDDNTYLGKVVTILTDMFGAERAAIMLIADETSNNSLNIAATRNFSPEEVQQLKKGPLRDLMSLTLDSKKPLIIADLKKNRKLFPPAADYLPIKSLACVPLVIDSKSMGLFYVDNRLLKGIFSKKDLVVMTAIATQIALFLKTTNLYRELKRYQVNFEEGSFYSEQIEAHEGFAQIIGKSEAIRGVLSKVKKVAETDTTVLIQGETGVGKELIARAIHQLSHRAKKTFAIVNVSALTENLLSSELFGYEKGAFTGAERSRAGRFEMADGGTIFLDEIGELSIEAQVKLLRVLQEGEFERVGGTKTIRSDFRLIVATNRDLRDMVARGAFRSDLFYRISSFPIEIPPLRERKKDIPHLALHFMQKHKAKNLKNLKRIPEREIKKLQQYSWPGNVRELEHVIERAVILSENESLTISDLDEHSSIEPEEARPQDELLTLDEIERKHIINVLNRVKWRVRGNNGAANILGLKPSTLEFRMKKLEIER